MAINDEVRRLDKKWRSGTGWPKRLEWLELQGIRGWEGQRLSLPFPIVAIAGENGSGKSTLLQAAACVYRPDTDSAARIWYPSEFFPDTAWDEIRGAEIRYGWAQGGKHEDGSKLRKHSTRWLGHGERPIRAVEYIDLNRVQPVATRVGYARIAKTKHEEQSARPFDQSQVKRLSHIMGRTYDSARMALSTIDRERDVPVISQYGTEYSGFHQGSGETMATEFLKADFPKYGLVLIDEIESSLHPRAQRRLIRDLAEISQQREIQIVISTHSPYILEELPPEARMYILVSQATKKIIPGVSPEFALTKMDDDAHPECDLYIEDRAAQIMLGEILALHRREVFPRCAMVPFGATNVGYALGQMASAKKFQRPSCVFLDGDSAPGQGCVILPGGDAPERVVFNGLRTKSPRFGDVWTHIARDLSSVDDACMAAMTLNDHHDWVTFAANQLMCSGDTLWQAMCAEWAKTLTPEMVAPIVNAVEDALP